MSGGQSSSVAPASSRAMSIVGAREPAVRQDSGARLRLAVARTGPARNPGIAPPWPPKIRPSWFTSWMPRPQPTVQSSGLSITCGDQSSSDRRLGENAVCALGEHDGPARQVADRRPELPHGGDAAHVAVCGSRAAVPAYSSTRYPAARGSCSSQVVRREAERSEDPAVDVVGVRHAARAGRRPRRAGRRRGSSSGALGRRAARARTRPSPR